MAITLDDWLRLNPEPQRPSPQGSWRRDNTFDDALGRFAQDYSSWKNRRDAFARTAPSGNTGGGGGKPQGGGGGNKPQGPKLPAPAPVPNPGQGRGKPVSPGTVNPNIINPAGVPGGNRPQPLPNLAKPVIDSHNPLRNYAEVAMLAQMLQNPLSQPAHFTNLVNPYTPIDPAAANTASQLQTLYQQGQQMPNQHLIPMNFGV